MRERYGLWKEHERKGELGNKERGKKKKKKRRKMWPGCEGLEREEKK